MYTNSKKTKLAIAIQTSIVSLSFHAQVNAATIDVTAIGDNPLSDCTLREAVTSINVGNGVGGCSNSSANLFGVDDTVLFSNNLLSNTIVLSIGDIAITKDIVIQGNANDIIIDADNQSRIFEISDSVVSLENLTLRNGNALTTPYIGGAIDAQSSTLNITNSTLTNNSAGDGGAIILRGGSLTLTGSDLTSNTATGDGGAISLLANILGGSKANIIDSTFSQNTATGYGGGAINAYYYASLSITGSTFDQNLATGSGLGGGGGALRSVASKTTIIDSIFTANSATERGGAINAESSNYNYNALNITGSTISDNSAPIGGGLRARLENVTVGLEDIIVSNNSAAIAAGMTVVDGDVLVTQAKVFGNSASNFAGAIQFSGNTATLEETSIYANNAGSTGGISLSGSATLNLNSSTVSTNSVTGFAGGLSISMNTTANITNSTISGNSAVNYGGGISVGYGTLNLKNSTLADNLAAAGGGLRNISGNINIVNSILANS